MAIQIFIMPSAERDLGRMDRIAAQRVGRKLREIEAEGRVVGDVKRLTGSRRASAFGSAITVCYSVLRPIH